MRWQSAVFPSVGLTEINSFLVSPLSLCLWILSTASWVLVWNPQNQGLLHPWALRSLGKINYLDISQQGLSCSRDSYKVSKGSGPSVCCLLNAHFLRITTSTMCSFSTALITQKCKKKKKKMRVGWAGAEMYPHHRLTVLL